MPNCHSWSIVYPYTPNISHLTITLHESLGPHVHSYVSIVDAYKSKTIQVIALTESLNLDLVGRFFGEDFWVIIKVSLCTLSILQYIYLIYTLYDNIYNIYISYIHFMPSIYIYITYIYSMYQHTYLIHTLHGILHPSIYISHTYISCLNYISRIYIEHAKWMHK